MPIPALTFAGPGGVTKRAVLDGEVTVGTDPANVTVLPFTGIAPRHCRFYRVGESVWLEDSSGGQGTRVNGNAISAPVTVSARDQVLLGTEVTVLVLDAHPTVAHRWRTLLGPALGLTGLALLGLVIPSRLAPLPMALPAVAPPSKLAPSPGERRRDPTSGLEMVWQPPGTFRMGCVPGDVQCDQNERPPHLERVEGFWMGRTDVTVGAFAKCADAGACIPFEAAIDPLNTGNWMFHRLDHPMNLVNWSEAHRFCRWMGGRLPTAAQWEYAARGGEDRIYPWGSAPVTAQRANFCDVRCSEALMPGQQKEWRSRQRIDPFQDDGWAGTSPVGTYPAGASRWGLLDMAGNAWQWTSTRLDPVAIEVRGGSFSSAPHWLRTTKRSGHDPNPDCRGTATPTARDDDLGFRCVWPAAGPATPADLFSEDLMVARADLPVAGAQVDLYRRIDEPEGPWLSILQEHPCEPRRPFAYDGTLRGTMKGVAEGHERGDPQRATAEQLAALQRALSVPPGRRAGLPGLGGGFPPLDFACEAGAERLRTLFQGPSTPPYRHAITGPDGLAHLDGLTSDETYLLSVKAPDGGPRLAFTWKADGEPVDVIQMKSETRVLIDFAGFSVEGLDLYAFDGDDRGNTPSWAALAVEHLDGGAFVVDTASGWAFVVAVAPGRLPGFLSWRSQKLDDVVHAKDLSLFGGLRPAQRYVGTVTRHGVPVAGAQVSIEVEPYRWGSNGTFERTTDARGQFSVDSLPHGQIIVQAWDGSDYGVSGGWSWTGDAGWLEEDAPRPGGCVGEIELRPIRLPGKYADDDK